MNKSELTDKVAEKSGLSKKDAALVVDQLFDSIAEALGAGEKVQILGFGNFEVRERSERKGRNPQTGEEITIAGGKVPAFKAGNGLKKSVSAE